ncbi:MAG: insulinase family protein [Parachlamydiaceae bacterium]|nr:insulinase family protein [Parachlamydiaceae bacterium]
MLQMLLSFSLIILSFLTPLLAEEFTIIEDKTSLPILTPSLAKRETLKLRLSNNLEAYIISDPNAIQSGATLVVASGSWSDPVEYPGLAHFLEHMLFLGNEKYPVESEYDRYIKEHGGESNAYTAPDHTLYLFSINNNAFPDALDRFSQFFKKPLFNPSGVSRELQAIDQEFAKNFTSDSIREHYVDKELSNLTHPFHRFNSGNSDTLSKVSQKTLKQWYNEHYSANLMHVILYSPLPIETLKKMVVQDFKDIPNTNRSPTDDKGPITSEMQKGHIVYIEPLRDVRNLRIMWELPVEYAHMQEENPAHLICYILGHEGDGSLLQELKQEHLAENLSCSSHHLSSEHYFMAINIELTEKGLLERNLVLEKFFGTLTALRKQGIPSYIFDENKKMETLRYQYQAKTSPFDMLMKMGEGLLRENLDTFPEHTMIIQKYNPQAIQSLLDFLTPENAWITLMVKPESLGIKLDRTEKWMKIPYSINTIDSEQINRWSKAAPPSSWHLPEANPFIPKAFTIEPPIDKEQKIAPPIPEVIVNTDDAKIYFAKDLEFQIPQTMWFFEIKTPSVTKNNPKNMALAELYTNCLTEVLNSYSYNAKLADLDFEINHFENGIELNLKGYQDNAELLFDAILEHLKNCKPTPQLYEQLKNSLLRQYRNFMQEGPIKQGLEAYQTILYQEYATHLQKANALENVTYEDFLTYVEHLFDKTYTEALIYGSVEKDQALRVWQKLQKTLSSSPYLIKEQPVKKIITLPENLGPFYIDVKVDVPGNAIILGIEDILFSFKTRAAQQILSRAMNSPFYHALRTKQQTGYIVYNSAEELEKHLFSFFIVQSNTHDPRELLARFELFIETFLQEMSETELTEEKFEVIREALQTTYEQPPQSLTEMGEYLKVLAFKYDGDFDWTAKRIQGFKDLTYADFLEIATQFLEKSNKRRLALLVQGSEPKNKNFLYHRLRNFEEIKNLSKYGSSH